MRRHDSRLWAGCRFGALVLILALPLAAKDSCLECHKGLEGNLQKPALAFQDDIHAHFGFSCADCHGGDRNSNDMEESMNRARGFTGKIARGAVPKLCARCHSDATLIHKFKPQQRVDQLAQYQTSVHGKRLAAGDTAVANCVDCHSVHNIREVKNALSPVHPLRLPETCARCHADAKHMAKYKIETNQFAQYRGSVHWEALSKRGDLSAPSCASCHGNHGATPPQVASVASVCGTCHVLFEDLYSKSPHKPVFDSMGAAGCVVCHGNHGISKPSSAMLVGAKAVCAQCHDATSAGGAAAAEMGALIAKLDAALNRSDAVLAQAQNSGMEVSEPVLQQIEGRENLIKARVAVHAFQTAAVNKPVQDGLAIAAGTRKAGEDALQERDWRRAGLGVSLITIVITLLGLWLAIRLLEARPRREPSDGRSDAV
ncbi:MAG: cytochrome c3 family protein [Acidobacteriia bacterium]|nr:cytochrome c3 family protein [Terriglobia bacterium]